MCHRVLRLESHRHLRLMFLLSCPARALPRFPRRSPHHYLAKVPVMPRLDRRARVRQFFLQACHLIFPRRLLLTCLPVYRAIVHRPDQLEGQRRWVTCNLVSFLPILLIMLCLREYLVFSSPKCAASYSLCIVLYFPGSLPVRARVMSHLDHQAGVLVPSRRYRRAQVPLIPLHFYHRQCPPQFLPPYLLTSLQFYHLMFLRHYLPMSLPVCQAINHLRGQLEGQQR